MLIYTHVLISKYTDILSLNFLVCIQLWILTRGTTPKQEPEIFILYRYGVYK